MQKTPVSILQEMMVKKGTVPNYELIHDGGGSHENTFTYRVTCDGLAATGIGRCKKDAKHSAASNMLETIAKFNGFLPLQDSPAKSPTRLSPPLPKPEPYLQNPNEPFLNAIGALQDVCADHELMDPVYDTISDTGPPHARVFKMQCTVASFKEEGVSTTKKQAKHLAAKRMLERIEEILNDGNKSNISELIDLERFGNLKSKDVSDKSEPTNEQLKNLFLSIKGPVAKKPNLGVKLADLHEKVKSAYDKTRRQEMLRSLRQFALDLNHYRNGHKKPAPCENFIDKFRELVKPLGIEVGDAIICGHVAVLFLNTVPEIVELACGEGKPDWKLQIELCHKTITTVTSLFS